LAIGQHAYQVADFEAKIQKKEQASQGNDPEVTRLRDLIQKHQTLTANLRRQRPKIEQTITDAEAALVVAEAAANSATDTKLEASKQEAEQARRIENLKAQTGNRLNAFGNRIDLVMREIDKARWTAARPIGPLGMSVSLNDPRYKDTFHKQMGQTLCQFAVRNDQDRKTMMDILKRCQSQYVLISRGRKR
jgi:chromosome segregation ATPase